MSAPTNVKQEKGPRLDEVRTSILLVAALFAPWLGCECADEPASVSSGPATSNRLRTLLEGRCEAMLECGCIEDVGACVEASDAALDTAFGRGRAELEIDEACLDDAVDLFAAAGCDLRTEQPRERRPFCRLAAGAAGVGEACSIAYAAGFTLTSCAAGLDCSSLSHQCFDPSLPPPVVAAGEPCIPGNSNCPEEYVCTLDGWRCVAIAAEGEACAEDRECAAGLYCDTAQAGPGRCRPQLAIGEHCPAGSINACDPTCAEQPGTGCVSIRCRNGICEPPPPFACEPFTVRVGS